MKLKRGFDMRRKRGSLALSINAIVILILAITMLGLGLTFIRGLFTSAEGKITEIADAAELANPPTRDNIMTVFPNQLEFRKNKEAKVEVAYLNTEDDGTDCKINGFTFENGVEVIRAVYPRSTVNMRKDGINLWTVLIIPIVDPTAADQTGLFTVEMICDATLGTEKKATKDILVTIKP
tara:strand:- start:2455 stop:2994 length:540 start_codon:yes stop_codon:yes gene_type:complete